MERAYRGAHRWGHCAPLPFRFTLPPTTSDHDGFDIARKRWADALAFPIAPLPRMALQLEPRRGMGHHIHSTRSPPFLHIEWPSTRCKVCGREPLDLGAAGRRPPTGPQARAHTPHARGHCRSTLTPDAAKRWGCWASPCSNPSHHHPKKKASRKAALVSSGARQDHGAEG